MANRPGPIHPALRLAALASLVLVPACVRPQADPWPGQVQEALRSRASSLAAADRPSYEEGFANGASMVAKAVKAGLRPYRPLPDAELPTLDGSQGLPPGATSTADSLRAEVDLATGLVAFPAAGAAGSGYARGQADGFTWALDAVGRDLVRPRQEPRLPDRWTPWAAHQRDLPLQAGPQEVRFRWSPGLLAWTWKERGFPGRRTWRAWPGDQAPTWVGADAQAVWVEVVEGRAVALDLDSGGILAVRTAPPHAALRKTGLEAYEAAVAEEFASPAFQQELARLRQAAQSGSIEDLVAVAKKLGGMGPAADKEAFGWYLQAAEKGSPDAMLRVGVSLFHGGPVGADKAAAKGWLDRAARAGHPLAASVKATLFEGEGNAAAPAP
jgi:hypothetical protein